MNAFIAIRERLVPDQTNGSKATYKLLFYTGAVLLWGLAGTLAGTHVVFLLALTFAAAQLAWQVATLDISDPANCLARFKSNRLVGWLLFLGTVADMGAAAVLGALSG